MQAEISGTMTDEAATVTSIQDRIRHYIVSASGIRAVFAADGDENSETPEISAADRIIAGLFALSYLRFMQKRTGKPGPVIATGSDSRPTGREPLAPGHNPDARQNNRTHHVFITIHEPLFYP